MKTKETKVLKIGVICVGNIFPSYLKALEYVPEIQIKKTFDAAGKQSAGISSCNDLSEILKNQEIEVILISTPPGTHFELAEKVLMAGKDVILEKPPVEKIWQLIKLGGLANTFGRKVFTSFHAAHCLALEHFLEDVTVTDQGTFHSEFGMLKSAFSYFFDPYIKRGQLKEGINLGGSWMDSAPNALSIMFRLVSKVKITGASFFFSHHCDKNCREISGNVWFDFPGANEFKWNIVTNWNIGKNLKLTVLRFEKEKITIHHTYESIYDGSGRLMQNFTEDGVERLTHQYVGAFRDIYKMIRSGENNFSFATNVMTALEGAYNVGGVKI